MKLVCPVARPGGSLVELHGTEYHFLPQEDGQHVCEVENEAHQDRFLEIGYKVYRPRGKVVPLKPLSDAIMSKVHPETVTIEGKEVNVAAVAKGLAEKAGVEAWNALSDEERHDQIDAALTAIEQDAGSSGDTNADAERTALIDAHVAKFGKKPHHKLSNEKIKALLAEGDA